MQSARRGKQLAMRLGVGVAGTAMVLGGVVVSGAVSGPAEQAAAAQLTPLPCDGSTVQLGSATLSCSGTGKGSVSMAYRYYKKRKYAELVAFTTGGATIGAAGTSESGQTARADLLVNVPGTTGESVTATLSVPSGEAVTTVTAHQRSSTEADFAQAISTR